jgi:hypothetical protein
VSERETERVLRGESTKAERVSPCVGKGNRASPQRRERADIHTFLFRVSFHLHISSTRLSKYRGFCSPPSEVLWDTVGERLVHSTTY